MDASLGITVENITVERGGYRALIEVSFSVAKGTLVGVLGPNGAGKSTLFDAIAGIIPVSQGLVNLHDARNQKGALAYVPQRDNINWRYPATLQDVVAMGRYCHICCLRSPGRRDRRIVQEALERVGLWERRRSLITEISGGQRQRTFIARALAQEARIIMLDEAFSGVDVGSQESIVEVLQDLRDEGKVLMLATHDLTNLAERFDLVLCLNRHVCAFGPPDDAFTPEVLHELYGSHGIDFVQDHSAHVGHSHGGH